MPGPKPLLERSRLRFASIRNGLGECRRRNFPALANPLKGPGNRDARHSLDKLVQGSCSGKELFRQRVGSEVKDDEKEVREGGAGPALTSPRLAACLVSS